MNPLIPAQSRYNRVLIEISLGVAVLLLAIVALGWVLWFAAETIAPTQRHWLPYVSVVLAITFIFLLVHELGHVVVGVLLGLRWTHLHIKAVMSVRLEAPPGSIKTNYQQLAVSLAGPALEAFVGVLVLLGARASGAAAWDAISVAAIFAILDAIGNLLIPIRHSDGRRAAHSAWKVVRGHGAAAFN